MSVGAAHGDELAYLFKSELTAKVEKGSIEDLSIRRLSKLWTNFAKTGDPNSKDTLLNVEWKPAIISEINFLDFDETLTIGIDPDGDRMSFWHDIYKKYSSSQ